MAWSKVLDLGRFKAKMAEKGLRVPHALLVSRLKAMVAALMDKVKLVSFDVLQSGHQRAYTHVVGLYGSRARKERM